MAMGSRLAYHLLGLRRRDDDQHAAHLLWQRFEVRVGAVAFQRFCSGVDGVEFIALGLEPAS